MLHVLDSHSAAAYDAHCALAEAALERESQALEEGHPDPDAALRRKAKALEAKVHVAVALEQSRFLEEVVPRVADVLASGTLLARCRQLG